MEMDGLWHDLRYAARSLRARRGFTFVAVLTLALGVGANTAIFSAVNALLLRPLPVEDVDRLVFGAALREGFDPFGTSFLEYSLYRGESRSFVASGLGTPRLFALIGTGDPERLRGAAVTAGYLQTLGVRSVRGRVFTDADDRPSGPAVALIGHELWQRRFGGDPEIVGRLLSLEGRSCSIVGVMPPGFDMPYSAEVWVPMQVSIDSLPLAQRAATANEFVARLAPGVSLEQADTELKGLAKRLEGEYPQIRRGWSFGLVPLRQQLLADLPGRTHRLLVALSVAMGFLLLICCVNVANLLLARGVSREGEMAIRRSLGAGQGRLVRQLLSESLLLALLGGVAGVLLAFWLLPFLGALNPVQAAGLGPTSATSASTAACSCSRSLSRSRPPSSSGWSRPSSRLGRRASRPCSRRSNAPRARPDGGRSRSSSAPRSPWPRRSSWAAGSWCGRSCACSESTSAFDPSVS
jgi:putative ABC transport system permease protein